MDQSLDNQPINQSIDAPIIGQPINQSSNQSINQSGLFIHNVELTLFFRKKRFGVVYWNSNVFGRCWRNGRLTWPRWKRPLMSPTWRTSFRSSTFSTMHRSRCLSGRVGQGIWPPLKCATATLRIFSFNWRNSVPLNCFGVDWTARGIFWPRKRRLSPWRVRMPVWNGRNWSNLASRYIFSWLIDCIHCKLDWSIDWLIAQSSMGIGFDWLIDLIQINGNDWLVDWLIFLGLFFHWLLRIYLLFLFLIYFFFGRM